MERAVSVSRHDRCPVCGKSDWCRFLPAKAPGSRLVNCKRDTQYKDLVSSVDGRTYVFIKVCNDRSSLYIDEESQKREREIWREEHGYKGKGPNRRQALVRNIVRDEEKIAIEGLSDPLPDERLDKIYRMFLSLLELNPMHKEYLLREKWPEKLIKMSLARSLPSAKEYRNKASFVDRKALSRKEIAEELVKEFGTLEGVPGFFVKDGQWTCAGKQGLLFPLYNRKGEIFRLRIRVDYPDRDENGKIKNKYHNFSSFREERKEDGTLYNYYSRGTQAKSHVGFYNQFTKDTYAVYITEGEKKSLVANYVLGQPVLCVPGVNSFGKLFEPDASGVSMIDHAINLGAKVFIVAYDSDKSVNAKVLECETALVERLKEKKVQIGLAYWNIGFGKGLDDILGTGIRPNYSVVT